MIKKKIFYLNFKLIKYERLTKKNARQDYCIT